MAAAQSHKKKNNVHIHILKFLSLFQMIVSFLYQDYYNGIWKQNRKSIGTLLSKWAFNRSGIILSIKSRFVMQ